MGITVTVTNADGSVVQQESPVKGEVPWVPGLRFYRLSQASIDVFEAYRNLWLGFEALLDVICPKQRDEREEQWLLRALNLASATVDLTRFAPKDRDPSKYILGTQYEHIRLPLFHAKLSARSIPDASEVARAYERLITVWRAVAHACCGVVGGVNSGTTYLGFRHKMDTALSQGLSMYFTDDPSPASHLDTVISPLGRTVTAFQRTDYLSETAPGRVSFIGSLSLISSSRYIPVRRICSRLGGALLTVTALDDPIDLDGTDVFESMHTFCLHNTELPRVEFGP